MVVCFIHVEFVALMQALLEIANPEIRQNVLVREFDIAKRLVVIARCEMCIMITEASRSSRHGRYGDCSRKCSCLCGSRGSRLRDKQ
jgi:hypothetical protein